MNASDKRCLELDNGKIVLQCFRISGGPLKVFVEINCFVNCFEGVTGAEE